MDILLFGGAFDPPHLGHAGILSAALKFRDFDRVIVMPTGTPGHKALCKAPFHIRKYMARQAFGSLGDNIEVSDMEGNSLEKSYSYLTCEKILRQRPGRRIWFLIGSDSALSLNTWKNRDRLAKTVSFLIFSRDGDTRRARRAAKRIRKLSAGTRFVSRPVLPLSSTGIRRRAGRGEEPEGLCPRVARTIREYSLYSSDRRARIEGSARLLVKLLLRQKRAAHTYNVENLATRLARLYGEDVWKAHVAALLHDIMKQQPDELVLRRARRSDIIDRINSKNLPVLHGFAAADYARRELGIEDEDILMALKSHTCGRPGMSGLEKVIYLADMLCEERDFPEKERLLKSALTDLDLGMRDCLRRSVDWVKSRGVPLDGDSADALAYYKKVCSERNL